MARTAKLQRLTALSVRHYADNPLKTSPLHDGGGLYLRKRESSAFWYLRLRDPATDAQQWHRMFPDDPAGGYPHRSLANARTEAKRLWDLRSDGIDPRALRLQRIAEQRAKDLEAAAALTRQITVRVLFERWRAVELQPRIGADGRRVGRKDGGEYTRLQFERRVFPKVGNASVDHIKRGDLVALLDSVKMEGKLRTANMLFTDLKQMFRFALSRDLVIRNPLDTISKRDVGGVDVDRDRVLTNEEIRQLSGSIVASGLHERFAAGIWLILATGVRVGELLGAAWVDEGRSAAELRPVAEAAGVKLGLVDLRRRTWHLLDTKNQREHTIHLSDFALTQFQKLAGITVAYNDDANRAVPWIFPNVANDGPLGVKSFGKQISDRQKTPDRRLSHRSLATTSLLLSRGRWTSHDLRRTAATRMAELGFSGDVIDECLNHMIESRVRRTYIRDRRMLEQRKAFDALGARIQALLAGPPNGKPASQRRVGWRHGLSESRLATVTSLPKLPALRSRQSQARAEPAATPGLEFDKWPQ